MLTAFARKIACPLARSRDFESAISDSCVQGEWLYRIRTMSTPVRWTLIGRQTHRSKEPGGVRCPGAFTLRTSIAQPVVSCTSRKCRTHLRHCLSRSLNHHFADSRQQRERDVLKQAPPLTHCANTLQLVSRFPLGAPWHSLQHTSECPVLVVG